MTARALAFGGRMAEDRVVLGGFDRNTQKLQAVKHLVLSACGTSLYAAQYGARLMRELESLETVQARDAAELQLQDIPRRGGGLLVVSQSGETRDVFKALKHAELSGVPTMSVVNVVGSAIARETKLGVYLNAGREQAVASTKSFTTQVTVLALLSLWFRQLREAEVNKLDGALTLPEKHHLLEALQRLPISFGMAMRVSSFSCCTVAAVVYLHGVSTTDAVKDLYLAEVVARVSEVRAVCQQPEQCICGQPTSLYMSLLTSVPRDSAQATAQAALFCTGQRLWYVRYTPVTALFATVLRQCQAVASHYAGVHTHFLLGGASLSNLHDPCEPVAMEGALKLKEMAYLHAEGYSGGALKHGPFALLEGRDGQDGSTPIILIILDDEHAQQMRTAGEEVKARGADVIIITDNPKLAEVNGRNNSVASISTLLTSCLFLQVVPHELWQRLCPERSRTRGLDDKPIVIPNNGQLTALIAVLPLQ
eukprot:7655-Heterococcus_DN1.PRE.1